MKVPFIIMALFISVGNLNSQIKIKAERFSPFNEGLAIVSYGSATGIIDRSGKFIIPYNKYNFLDFGLGSLEPVHGFVNGGCVVKNPTNGLLGMINAKGILIIPAEYILVYPFDKEGWARVTDAKEKDYFINKSLAKLPIPTSFYAYRSSMFSSNGGLEDLFNGGPTRNKALSGREYHGNFSNNVSPGITEDGAYTFYNRAGKQAINGKFASAEPFNEGLACVSKVNEFGETKYGFIDILGKLTIPYMFSKKPGNFYNGLAYIEPSIKSDFDFAFINRKGDIVFKQKNSIPLPLIGGPHFEDGYFRMFVKSGGYQNFKMIDSTGLEVSVIASLKDKLKGITTKTSNHPFINQIQIFYYNERNNSGYGFVNVATGKVVYTNLSSIEAFDATSGLALAMDKTSNQVYIDQLGNIVIGIANRSEW